MRSGQCKNKPKCWGKCIAVINNLSAQAIGTLFCQRLRRGIRLFLCDCGRALAQSGFYKHAALRCRLRAGALALLDHVGGADAMFTSALDTVEGALADATQLNRRVVMSLHAVCQSLRGKGSGEEGSGTRARATGMSQLCTMPEPALEMGRTRSSVTKLSNAIYGWISVVFMTRHFYSAWMHLGLVHALLIVPVNGVDPAQRCAVKREHAQEREAGLAIEIETRVTIERLVSGASDNRMVR